SGVDVWQPMHTEGVCCPWAYCVVVRTATTPSSPGENPLRAAVPVIVSFVVQYTIAPVAGTGAIPIGVCAPSASPVRVLPACTPPRTLTVIACAGECVRSASHMAFGIVHDICVV